MEQEAKPRAKGRWTKTVRADQYLLATERVEVHTFTAASGYTAVMEKVQGRRTNPYTAKIKTPEGKEASRINEHGYRVTGMTMHMNQKDSRLTVEEAVHEVERQALSAAGEQAA